MKVTTLKEFKSLLQKYFELKIEGVNRARRSGDSEGDYHDEDEGPGVSYDESVDRANRGEETNGEYEDEDEGTGVTYETNLYADGDVDKVSGKEDVEHGEDIEKDTHEKEDLEETNLYTDADCEGKDETEKKGMGHAHPSDVEDAYPNPDAAAAVGEGLSLKEAFGVKKEVAPPGWEKTVKSMKKHKDTVDNPFALAWYMKNQGAKPKK